MGLSRFFAFSTRNSHLFSVKAYKTLIASTVLCINYRLLLLPILFSNSRDDSRNFTQSTSGNKTCIEFENENFC